MITLGRGTMYHFRNMIFEGGGVKGIAYIGALEALEKQKILPQITRVGGTSAGAINAVLLATGYSIEEMKKILWELDFNKFKDGGASRAWRLVRKYGLYKGDFFYNWMRELIEAKAGNPDCTFQDLHQLAGTRSLYLVGTNLSTHFAEIFSHEHTPNMSVANAARISMSIPLFFTAKKVMKQDIGRTAVYVDGGLLNNYPVKMFDRGGYVENPIYLRKVPYYSKSNESSGDNPYIYNQETLGFRLDSQAEIATFTGSDPKYNKIHNIVSYIGALKDTLMEMQESNHLHSDDWHRTIYIDTLGVKTTEFNLSDNKKNALIASGSAGVEKYFSWFDTAENAYNKQITT